LFNGEKHERKKTHLDLDRVFRFCCKLFNVIDNTSKLGNKGSRDWRNLSVKLVFVVNCLMLLIVLVN